MQNNTPQPRWISFLSISIGGRNMTLCFSTRVGKWHIARLRHWGILIQICPHKSGLWQHERLWPTTSHPTSHTHTSHFTAVTKLCVLFILSAGRLAGVAGSVQSSSAELEQYHHHTSRDPATLLTGWQCCSIYITYLILSIWPKADVMTRWWRQLWALMELSGADPALNNRAWKRSIGKFVSTEKAQELILTNPFPYDIWREGPSRGLLRDCEIFANLWLTFVWSSS